MTNQPCMVRPTVIKLHPHELFDDPFTISNMIKGINESRALTKHVSCE